LSGTRGLSVALKSTSWAFAARRPAAGSRRLQSPKENLLGVAGKATTSPSTCSTWALQAGVAASAARATHSRMIRYANSATPSAKPSPNWASSAEDFIECAQLYAAESMLSHRGMIDARLAHAPRETQCTPMFQTASENTWSSAPSQGLRFRDAHHVADEL